MGIGALGWMVGAVGWAAEGKAAPVASAPSQQEQASLRNPERIAQLIRQLGDPNYFVRQRAQNELAHMGLEAFEALCEAEQDEDLEIAARARYLIRLLRIQWVQPEDPPEVKRLLAEYESLPPEHRLQRIQSLADLPDAKGAEALCRLVRFEPFLVLSKRAAVELIRRHGPDQPIPPPLLSAMQKHLRGRRVSIQWLETFLQLHQDPAGAIGRWTEQVKAELAVFRHTPEQSSVQVVGGLLRVQSHWLAKLGRKKEAAAALAQLVELEPQGDPETLAELLEWLMEEKSYEAVEQLATRFPEVFRSDSILLYTLAQAQQALGRAGQAQQTAQQALQLHPGPQAEQILRHLMAALWLRRRGLNPWAEEEFRHVIRISPQGHRLHSLATIQLAEMLYDQGDPLRAAEVLQPLVQWFSQRHALPDALEELTPLSLQARMHYFYACHWAKQGDRAKQKQSLQQALQADPTDVDTLIACYHLAEQPPEWKKQIQSLIHNAVAAYREKIHEDPDDPTYYNHLAWLVGNTEGDLDEALRCVQKAIELSPDAGGYYDTLGRVYFARGDLRGALQSQTKAVQLEPHSQQIRRQWEEFQKAQPPPASGPSKASSP